MVLVCGDGVGHAVDCIKGSGGGTTFPPSVSLALYCVDVVTVLLCCFLCCFAVKVAFTVEVVSRRRFCDVGSVKGAKGMKGGKR